MSSAVLFYVNGRCPGVRQLFKDICLIVQNNIYSSKHKMRNYKYLAELFASGMEFTVVDTETTGLHFKKDRIIEIGAVRFNKNGIINRFGTLVQPPRPVSPDASKINGITDDMLLSAPAAKDVLPAFMDFIHDSKLVAHNAGFDISFLNKELLLCGMKELKPPAVPAVDTLHLARKVFPGLEKYTQTKLAEHFLIPVHHAHRAEDDARVCMEIFLKIIAAVPIVNRGELLQDQPAHYF